MNDIDNLRIPTYQSPAKQAAENARLRAELAAAQEVVRPFALHASHLNGNDSVVVMSTRLQDDSRVYLRYSHMRAAAAWLDRAGTVTAVTPIRK